MGSALGDMSNTVAITAQSPEVLASSGARPVAKATGEKPEATTSGQGQPDLRLVIEEDKSTGSFIYKTLDRRTGEIVQQYPREEVLRLRELPGYQPGDLTDSAS